MKSTVGAMLAVGIVLAAPLAISLTAAATSDKVAFRTAAERSLPMAPEPYDDDDGHE